MGEWETGRGEDEDTGTLVIDAPAKVNLALCIGRRRPDGFHDLESLFQAVGVCDTLTIEEQAAAAGITVAASDPSLPCDAHNTAFRAAALLRDRLAPGRGVRIHLEKRIPAEAGLGGGSSDAAAVLRGLNRLWQLHLSAEVLRGLAAEVGSDVPFFVTGGCALVRGRGESVEPLPYRPAGWFVLARPPFGVSTARAYADLAARRAGVRPPDCAQVTRRARAALESGDPAEIARVLWNDLEDPVVAAHPQIEQLREELLEAGALGARMSGSGSSVFGVFASREEAQAAAAQLAPQWPWVVVAPPLPAWEHE